MFFWLLHLELKTIPPIVCLDLPPAVLEKIVKVYYSVFIDNNKILQTGQSVKSI